MKLLTGLTLLAALNTTLIVCLVLITGLPMRPLMIRPWGLLLVLPWGLVGALALIRKLRL